jgi:hypothetical protein
LFATPPLFEVFLYSAIWREKETARKMEMEMAREIKRGGDGDSYENGDRKRCKEMNREDGYSFANILTQRCTWRQ